MGAFGENCFIVEVNAAGDVDDYGDITGVGSTVWSGRAAGHIRRQRQRIYNESGFTLEDKDAVIVRDVYGLMATDFSAGDQRTATTVLIEDCRVVPSVTVRYTVDSVEHRAGGTICDSLKLMLCDRAIAE